MYKTNVRRALWVKKPAAFFAAFLATQTMFSVTPTELLVGSAQALPQTCVIRIYYNNASHQTEVGMRSTCPGAKRWGRTSQFVEVERVSLVPEGPGGGGSGPGGLPCEFQSGAETQAECNNLPTPRN